MSDNDQQNKVFDSSLQQLGGVYAKALFGAAEKAGNTDQVVEQLDSVVDDVIEQLPKLEATLSSPRVPPEEKAGMLDKAFRDKIAVELLNFLKVLTRHGRFECLRAVRRSLHQLRNEARNIVEVQLTSAEPLSDQLRDQVVSRLTDALGSEVVVREHVDPDVIGGLVVRVGDTVFDGSIANRLVQLRKSAVEKAAQEIRKSVDRFVLAE